MPDDELLTVPEVMTRLKVSRSTLYGLIRTGELQSVKVGRSRRFPPSAVRAFVAGLVEAA